MTLVAQIVGALGGNVLSGANDILKTVIGSEAEREANLAAEQQSAQASYAAEWTYTRAGKRTWFDGLVDGVNRLVRPTFTFGTVALFVWAVYDPSGFTVAMQALATVPEPLWIIVGAVVVFWFGSRSLADHQFAKAAARAVTAIKGAQVVADQVAAEKAYQREMADTTKPLSNAAIMEWNRRRKAARGE